MTLTMVLCGLLWLFVLAGLLIAPHLSREGGVVAAGASGAGRLTMAALVGGACGLVLWSLVLLGPATTFQIETGEFGWLPYVTRYPLQMVLAGALVGLVVAASLRRVAGRPALGLRVVGVLALGWTGYGLVLAQVPAPGDLPTAVVLAQRSVAALGSAALSIALVDLLLHPPVVVQRDARLVERVALLIVSIQMVLLAQTMVWDELLARVLGLPVQ